MFGSSADPVALDGALISDGESGRAIIQIFEGLVALKPGHDEGRAVARDELEVVARTASPGRSRCAAA